MDTISRIHSLLGLAARGRNLTSGEAQVLDAIRTGEAQLIIVSEDASDNTKKLFTDKCSYYEVPVKIWGTREGIGHAIGKELRASVAVLEPGFADKITKLMEE